MPGSNASPLRKAVRTVVVFVPWVLSCFILYWLQYDEIWTTDTPHRGKTSVAILAAGIGLSFLLRSRFDKSD